MKTFLPFLFLSFVFVLSARAEYYSPRQDIRLGDVEVITESGVPQKLLGMIDQKKPLLLIPGYYSCDSTCPLVVENLIKALRDSDKSDQLQVLFLSFKNTDGVDEMKMFKAHHQIPESWHLTVAREESSAKELLAPLGYQFRKTKFGFDHPNAAFVFSSDERIWSGLLTGTNNTTDDIAKALSDAAFVNRQDGPALIQKTISRPENIIAYAFVVIVLSLACVSIIMVMRPSRP